MWLAEGLADWLGTVAEGDARAYAAMSRAIATGVTTGFVFPRRGGHRFARRL